MTLLVSLPRECVGKSTSRSILFDETPDSLQWSTPDPRVSPMALMTTNLVLDPFVTMQREYPDIMWTNDQIMIATENPPEVYKKYHAYDHFEVPLESQYVSQYTRGLKSQLKPEVAQMLSDLVHYCGVAMTVTSNFVLNVYGPKAALAYAQYKIFVLLNSLYGYSIHRIELDLAKQPLVSGPERQHLFTLFQQTGVNVYMPPVVDILPNVCVDEVYLAGDRLQLLVAEKILKDIIHKTDSLEKECVVSSFVRDILALQFSTDIERIMLKYGTFIQLPSTSNTVRVMGPTRQSIDNSISELVRLYSLVYCVEVQAHLDQSLAGQMAALGLSACSTKLGTVLYGSRESVHRGLDALKLACGEGINISVLLEQPLELMDFILGKKQGKIHRVISGTGTGITVEKCHGYNFRLRLSGDKVANILDALLLLEGELPAEKSLYIPEVYHKQVIGQGGLAVQRLMRKHNVYMRFANTTKEKYPNAFGDSRSDNVVIRCPAKNKREIDNAAQELLQNVEDLAKGHYCSYVKLTRNHRRLLLATQSNGLREIEVSSGAAIKLPLGESRETQLIEISGQTRASTENAVSMMTQLFSHTDYEFRVPWTPNFAEVVGSQSQFNEKVGVPLFLAMSAQVQAFEKVQIVGDPNIYSQVVVSVGENVEGEFFDEISEIVTAYLRNYHLDIVDKGKLNTELQIVTPESLKSETTQPQVSRGGALYRSPTQQPAIPIVLGQPQPTDLQPSEIPTISAFTPEMRPLQPSLGANWNRNFDETPVKRRAETENVPLRHRGRERLNRLQRRL